MTFDSMKPTVISRKKGESIQIGSGVRVTVTKVSGSKVTLAIFADNEVKILRAELVEQGLSAPDLTESAEAA